MPSGAAAAAPEPVDVTAGHAIYMDFKTQTYRFPTGKMALSAAPGYLFTDNVDNAPNINASGYNSTTAEVSSLQADINPLLTEQDYMLWGAFTLAAHASAWNMLLSLGGAELYMARRNDGLLVINHAGETGLVSATAAGRYSFILRRRAGKLTRGVRAGGVNSIYAEDATAGAFPAFNATMFIGRYRTGGLQTNGFNEFIGLKQGTFSDTELADTLTNV